jgi:hypothetical protein
MKKAIRKWVFRLTVTGIFIAGLLLVIILNPILCYANKTSYKNNTIFHHKPLDQTFLFELDRATAIIKTSEYYNAGFKTDICLNDGSIYPAMMQKLRGPAFAWGFYNKVVLMGNASYKENYVEINGYKWNLVQLLAHEMVHCLQFKKRGFWKSNPVAKIPGWKWEGYPEYVARQAIDQKDLKNNIDRLIQAEQINNNGWILFSDGTGTTISYYRNWLLIQYCMDIQKMTYEQILHNDTPEEIIRQEMMNWYKGS